MGDTNVPAGTTDPITNPIVSPATGDNSSAPTQTAPAKNSTLPAAAPGADTANNAQPIAPSGPVASSNAPTGPQPIPGANAVGSSNKPQNMAQKVLSGLMGGRPTTYEQTDKGPVPVQRDWKPGELARHVVASAASLLAAGIGGEQAAKNKRPFELAPGTSLGDIKDAQQEKDKADAQAQFENKQNQTKLELEQERGAREQQDSMIRKGEYDMAHSAWVTAHVNDDLIPQEQRLAIQSRMQDENLKMTADYQRFLTMPGSQVMKDAKGNELNFNTGDEAKAYATEHPEVFHGMTNGKSKFGVVVVANPVTGQTQLIDFPADQHEKGLTLVGALQDKNGEYVTDKDGNFVPYGSDEAKKHQAEHPDDLPGRTILDPTTRKPTYLTDIVTPDQVRQIYSADITQDKVRSQINNFKAQADLREAEIRKYPELRDSMSLVDSGNYNLMTDRQKDIAKTFALKQETIAGAQQKNAEANLLKTSQLKASGDPDITEDDIKKAQEEVEQAKDEKEDWSEKYNNLSNNTVGKRFANRAIRDGRVFTQPWGVTSKAIEAAPMSAVEQKLAKDTIWNTMTPEQRAQTNPTPETQAKAVAANQANAPAAKPHSTPQNPAAQGFTYLYDLEGLPHAYPNDHVDKFLASPGGKGWTK